jgi:hypothetical protein
VATTATTWTPPVYVDGTDFTCATFCSVEGMTGWGTAVLQLQLAMNRFALALGRTDSVLVTGALDASNLALAQALGKAITSQLGATSPLLKTLAAATQPADIAPYPTQLAIDFDQARVQVQKLARAKSPVGKAVHYLIAGGSTLAVIGATIALVSASRRNRPRKLSHNRRTAT